MLYYPGTYGFSDKREKIRERFQTQRNAWVGVASLIFTVIADFCGYTSQILVFNENTIIVIYVY